MDSLLAILERWQEDHNGLIRVVIQPVDKHTGKPLDAEVRFPLECLASDIREATEALAFYKSLTKLFGREP